jgi:thiol-disulfide isomerase/thioredoxin
VKSWASDAILGASWRETLIRAALALVALGVVVWLLPIRRPGEDGAHHGAAPGLDPFEKAGVVELKEGQPAPAFTLGALDGGRASLADHRDKLVVLNFWATWCQPCALEMPSLEALWRRYRERGLVVVGVSVDRGSPRGLLEPYVRNLKLTFPIHRSPGRRGDRDGRGRARVEQRRDAGARRAPPAGRPRAPVTARTPLDGGARSSQNPLAEGTPLIESHASVGGAPAPATACSMDH